MRYNLSFLLLVTLILSACIESNGQNKNETARYPKSHKKLSSNCNNKKIVSAIEHQKSNIQVLGCGSVVKVLPDDIKGNKHQKMIVKLSNIKTKRTILIAHNIDLAPRVKNLIEGDKINFYGEYEYTQKGGVVHWTHHDPANRHEDGWIEKDGMKYD